MKNAGYLIIGAAVLYLVIQHGKQAKPATATTAKPATPAPAKPVTTATATPVQVAVVQPGLIERILRMNLPS